jgi:hypothetical protein
MSIIKLAELFVLKCKLAGSSDDLEGALRKKIDMLWTYPNKTFNILKACAESNASSPKNDLEKAAVAGYKFCKEVLEIVEWLKQNKANLNLGEIRETVIYLLDLINTNKNINLSSSQYAGVQFPHVSELIFQLIPIKTKSDIKLRNDQFSKAKTGLSRVLSVALDMMDDISKLEIMVPEKFTVTNLPHTDLDSDLPERFKPQRAPLSQHDILDFIRQHGEDYGISSKEDWELVFDKSPSLKDKITTIINYINRSKKDHKGKPLFEHYESYDMKVLISEILKEVKQIKSTNAYLFEDSE